MSIDIPQNGICLHWLSNGLLKSVFALTVQLLSKAVIALQLNKRATTKIIHCQNFTIISWNFKIKASVIIKLLFYLSLLTVMKCK